jgi:DNA repair exonuclease SbcCD ATPase subunit
MIIKRVWAENVLKYGHLEIVEVPSAGLVGISGANEAGKTTIGEVICFALFGRTFSVTPEEVVKVIRWGEARCAVQLDFTTGDGRAYQVARYLDEDGNQGARLGFLGEEQTLAKGAEVVTAAVTELIHFGYDEFIESFYLAQREITTPHPHSVAVKTMAGIAALEEVVDQFGDEVQREQEGIADTEARVAEVRQQITELDLQPDYLPGLESERTELAERREQAAKEAEAIATAAARCEETVARVQRAVVGLQRADRETPYRDWRVHVQEFEQGLDEVERHCAEQREPGRSLSGELRALARDRNERLAAFQRLLERARQYRERVAGLLADPEQGAGEEHATEPLAARWAQATRDIEDARSARGRARFGLWLFLLVAIIAWAVWALVTQAAGTGVAQALAALPGTADGAPWWLGVAVVATVLALFFGVRSARLGTRIDELERTRDEIDTRIETARREAEELERLEVVPLPQAVSALQSMGDESLAGEAREFGNGPGRPLIEDEAVEEQRGQVDQQVIAYQSGVERMCEEADHATAALNRRVAELEEQVAALDGAIAEERARVARARELASVVGDCERRIETRRQRIRERELGQELLGGASRHIAKRFNRDIRNLVGATLPLFTEGRYEHLQIDENLEVQVFSSEKRDFVNLDEVSSGTQRQIRLAVRLALSQELINTTVRGPQFVFLDEPFAFFDQQRMRNTMQVLPTLSDEMTQIWIIAQHFPEDAAFDLHIECSREQEELRVAPPRARPEASVV